MFPLEKLFYTCFCTEALSSVAGNCWKNKHLSVHGIYVATIKPLLLLVVLYNIIPIVKGTGLHQSSHLRSNGVALCVNLQSCFERKKVSQWNPFWLESSLIPWKGVVLWQMMLILKPEGGDLSKAASKSYAEAVLWLKHPTISGRCR